MALSKKSALELVRIAKKNKIIYTIGHMKRHDERIIYLKNYLKNNSIKTHYKVFIMSLLLVTLMEN